MAPCDHNLTRVSNVYRPFLGEAYADQYVARSLSCCAILAGLAEPQDFCDRETFEDAVPATGVQDRPRMEVQLR